MIVPDAMHALLALGNSAEDLKKAGQTHERLFALAAWRDAPYFTEAERAALALTEAATRLSDRQDPVSDEIWDEAARHYDETALAAPIISIATITSGTASTSPPGRWRASGCPERHHPCPGWPGL